MGRTVPTYVQLISEQTEKWYKFRRALRREDQLHFDRLVASTRFYSPAGTFQTSDDPREAIVLSMLLDLQKRVAGLEARLKMPETNVPTSTAGELFPASEAPASTPTQQPTTQPPPRDSNYEHL
jgi:hypothetical protein